MEWLRRLFCKHIYKLEDKIYLHTTSRVVDNHEVDKTHHYAEKYVCILCGKVAMKKSTIWLLPDKEIEKQG